MLLSRPAFIVAALALAAALPLPALAHKASDAYLQLRALPAEGGASAPGSGGIELRWDIALRDLDAVVDLDADGDGRITWREVKAAWPAVDAYALARIALDGCPLRPDRHGLERRSDGAYAVLWLRSSCALPADPKLRYTLLHEVDPTHRGLLKIERDGQPVQLRVLDPAPSPVAGPARADGTAASGVASGQGRAGATGPGAHGATDGSTAAAVAPSSFLREGIHHILTGYDHVLFLLALLLPAVMRRTAPAGRPPTAAATQTPTAATQTLAVSTGMRPTPPAAAATRPLPADTRTRRAPSAAWQPVATLGQAVWPIAGIVTAFTVAHSITLALAALKLATLPGWFVEPAIAATIVVAALDNLRPVFGRLPRAAVAFAFGLVHGFGFAGVLGELDLPTLSFALALFQFNLGLELGQLAIVAVVVGAFYALRRWQGYPRWVIGAGSAAAMALGALWFVERTAGVSVMPF